MLFTLNNIIEATSGRVLATHGSTQSIYRIVTDTRSIKSNPTAEPILFWALRGNSFDAHDFVDQAVANGAQAILVDESFEQTRTTDERVTVIVVSDTTQALNDIASWHRQQLAGRIIGVTGSYGKTTTREMIHAVLNANLKTHQSQQNFNNHWGVPFSVLGIEHTHQASVLEFGASSVGEIDALCQIARPTIGVVTGIGKAHVERFGSLAQIVTAKKELVQAVPHDGLVILPGDSAFCSQLANEVDCENVIRVGTNSVTNDIYPDRIQFSNNELCVTVNNYPFRVQVAGTHFVNAVLAAIAVGRSLELSDEQIAAGLQNFRVPKGRCHVQQLGNLTLIDDTYNASPEAVQAACQLLGSWQTSGPRILVLGDMLELGQEAISCHEEIGIAAAANGLDYVLTFGDYSAVVTGTCIDAGFPVGSAKAFGNINELVRFLETLITADAVILVKGSRGMRMERIVEAIETRYQVLADCAVLEVT
jgi:UDP-N-acetylmuramoyl-tripeptide--D-alanyl-D-alanine ligase